MLKEVNIGDSEAATPLYWVQCASCCMPRSSINYSQLGGHGLSELPKLVLTHDDRLLLRSHVRWADTNEL